MRALSRKSQGLSLDISFSLSLEGNAKERSLGTS